MSALCFFCFTELPQFSEGKTNKDGETVIPTSHSVCLESSASKSKWSLAEKCLLWKTFSISLQDRPNNFFVDEQIKTVCSLIFWVVPFASPMV